MSEYNENYEQHDTTNHYHHDDKNTCFHHKHPFLSHLLTALSVLLGAYLAFYTVSDWHFKRMLDPVHQMRKMERMMMKEDRAVQRMVQRDLRTEKTLGSYIQIAEQPDAYIITVNLKPFDNNEDNVSIATDDDILTVHASNEKDNKTGMRALSVSQSYAFSRDVNFSKITKKRTGDKYIITVPVE